MTDKDFTDWVGFHCGSTGATDRVVETLTAALTRKAIMAWEPTLEDLCECTLRLVKGRRVPQFPNEHTNAIGAELVALRTERYEAETAAPRDGDGCPDCAGSGLVVILHPRCCWNRRTVIDRRTQRVLTASAVCPRLECKAGRRVANTGKHPRLSDLNRRAGFTPDGPGLLEALREYEREEAMRARREVGPGPLHGLVGGMLHRMRAARACQPEAA